MHVFMSIMRRRALVALAISCLAAPAAPAAMIAFNAPATTSFAIGESFSLQLAGSDFTSTLDGGGVNLGFNASVLRLTSVAVDTTTWEFFADNGVIDNTAGLVSDILFASFEERVGSFSVALFTFETLAAGTSSLLLTESPLNPFASGGDLLDVQFGLLSLSVTGGTTEPPPSPVPLPATLWLMVGGLAALGAARKLKAWRRTATGG
jgi:hypothetical protein